MLDAVSGAIWRREMRIIDVGACTLPGVRGQQPAVGLSALELNRVTLKQRHKRVSLLFLNW